MTDLLNSLLLQIKQTGPITVADYMNICLLHPKHGYYSKQDPFGKKGDFITSPTISNLFSEIIAIWLISAWEKMGKPKIFNFVELGPGDGSLTKVIINTVKKFPELNKAIKIIKLNNRQSLVMIHSQNDIKILYIFFQKGCICRYRSFN